MTKGAACVVLGGLLAAAPALAQQQPAPARPAAPAQAAPAQAATPAPAAPAQATPERGWAVTCADAAAGAPRNCQLGLNLLLRQPNQPVQRLAQVILARQPETRSLGLVFQLPHGALLPAGMSWQVDEGEAQRLAFQTSDAEGLYVGLPVADDLLAALRRGTQLRLGFVLAARRETLVVPVPLAGFSEAVSEFFAAERGTAPPRR